MYDSVPKRGINNQMLRVSCCVGLIHLRFPVYNHLDTAPRVPEASLLRKSWALSQPRIPNSSVSLQKVIDFLLRKNQKLKSLNLHFLYSVHKSCGQRIFAIAVFTGM